MTPKLNWFDRLSGRFYWWCLRRLGMNIEDVERSRLYKTDPTRYRRIVQYHYFYQDKKYIEVE